MESEQGHLFEREIGVMTRRTEEDIGKANKNIKTKSKHSDVHFTEEPCFLKHRDTEILGLLRQGLPNTFLDSQGTWSPGAN